jgi:hypothetical protein
MLEQLPAERRQAFVDACRPKVRRVWLAHLFCSVGLHYAYLRDWRRQALFLVTLGGLLLWWYRDRFRVRYLVEEHNRKVAAASLSAVTSAEIAPSAERHTTWLEELDNTLADPRRRKRLMLVLLAGVLACITALAVGIPLEAKHRAERVRPFTDYIKQFRDLSSFTVVNEAPHARGRVLMIYAPSHKVDKRFHDLPREARARKPEEVGTVIIAHPPAKEQVGTYTDGAAAYRWSVSLEFIDTARQTLARTSVAGSEPPERTTGRGSRSGSHPDVTSYLKEMLGNS